MTNAKKELLDHVGQRDVTYVCITHHVSYNDDENEVIEGTLEEVLPVLDLIEYNAGFGTQYLFGTIWYEDGTWSTRGEYDGSEWWELHERPAIPTRCEDVTLDELSLRYARLHALNIKKGCGEIFPEEHFLIALLFLSDQFTSIGDDGFYRIPSWSDFYSKNLTKAENES